MLLALSLIHALVFYLIMNYIKLKSKGKCRKGQGKQQVNLFFYFIFMRYKYLSK